MCDANVVPSLSNFQVLRVLSMEKCSFQEDRPYHLEHLRRLPQLRYLGLESTHISKLPEEIGNLKFLQTLDLRGTDIRELPQSIGLLRKLKCLRADMKGVLITVPNWKVSLASLEELHLSTVDKSSIIVKELSRLTELLHRCGRVLEENIYRVYAICKNYKSYDQTFASPRSKLWRLHWFPMTTGKAINPLGNSVIWP